MDAAKQMEIEWQCSKLALRFAYYIDNFMFEDLAQLFTADAVFDRAGQILEGRNAIAEAIAHQRPHELVTRHMSESIHFLKVEEKRAEAVVYNVSYHGLGDPAKAPVNYQSPLGRMLDIHDTYELTAEGWKIARRIARPILEPKGWPHLQG